MLDRHSPPVRKLLDEIDEKIEGHHTSLERIGRSTSDHDVSRGQIKALRWVMTQIVGESQETELDG